MNARIFRSDFGTLTVLTLCMLCLLTVSCGGGAGGGGGSGLSYGKGQSGSYANTGRGQTASIGFNKDKPIQITQSSGAQSINWETIDLTVYKNGVPTVYKIDSSMTLNIDITPGTELYAEAVFHTASGTDYTASSDKIITTAGKNDLTLHVNYTLTFAKVDPANDDDVQLPTPATITYNSRGMTLPEATSTATNPPKTFVGWYFDDELKQPCASLKGVTGNKTLYPKFIEGFVVYDETNYSGFSTFTVKTADHLDQIAALLLKGDAYSFYGKRVVLANDITANPGFKGLGTNMNPFKGDFDGKKYTVHISIDGTGQGYGAFIQNLASGASVKNLKVTGSVSGGGNGSAGIVGNNAGLIEACCNAATVSTDSSRIASGICVTNYGTIRKCYNTNSVSNSFYYQPIAGGICGWNYATINYCYNTGSVSSTGGESGGIAGHSGTASDSVTMEYCWNSGSAAFGMTDGLTEGPSPHTFNNLYCDGASGLADGIAASLSEAYNLCSAGAGSTWISNGTNPPTLNNVP